VSITFYCIACTQKLRIADDFAGKLVACTRCGSRLRVPFESEEPRSNPPTPAPEEPPPPILPPARPRADKPSAVKVAPAEAPVGEFEPPELEPRDPLRAIADAPPREAPPVARFDESPVDEAPVRRSTWTGRKKKVREEPLVKPAMKIDFEELIDMTAMVDIVFFLLIFFLVTSMKAIDSTIPMPSPDPQKAAARESRSLSELESDNEYITVHIDRRDTISVEGAEIHNDRDLLLKLRDLRTSGNRPEKMLVIGHSEASHGTAVMVLDAGREVGIQQVRLAVADEND
jgi:biopolymer transport protein ExbD/DNA-directed RNA polymerase subunit RPC12/RpoP